MGRLGHLIGAILLFCAVARAGDWTIIKYDGRDYLSMRNVADFYDLGDYQRAANTLSLGSPGRSLRGTIGSNELYINGLKFILSYPIEQVDGEPVVSRMDLTKVIEPVLRPSRIRNAAVIDSVVLDPGHGGYDNGASSIWGSEKAYTLDVAWRAKPLLEAQGLRVYMTRTTDDFIPLEERVGFANQHPTALFIAIHFNSGGADANGIETYTLAPRGVPSMAADGPMLSDLRPCAGNVCDAENMALACATHASLICHARLYDRGIKRARFVVIRDITIPGVLIEGGFLSNPGDAQLIRTPEYREEEAQCIAIAVRNYRNAVNAPPPIPAGSSVVVRDDVDAQGAPAAPPPPIAEPPPTEQKPDVMVTGVPPSTPPPVAQVHPAPAVQAPKPAPTPDAQPPAQAQNEAGSRSLLTPIVD
jgi:N-acetylmuramoyl-L-alanine amidase